MDVLIAIERIEMKFMKHFDMIVVQKVRNLFLIVIQKRITTIIVMPAIKFTIRTIIIQIIKKIINVLTRSKNRISRKCYEVQY